MGSENPRNKKNKKRLELGISYQGVRAGYMRRNAFYRSFIKTSRKAFFDFLFLQFFLAVGASGNVEISPYDGLHMAPQ